MINFTLDKIQLRNVRCYGDEMIEMDFPLNNLTVFTGHVGAGKSTILKSVSMALYGEDGGAKGEKLSIDDMVNEKNKKNLEIHLFFHSTVDDNSEETKYEIHLFHKHSKYNNKLVFVKNGRDISLESKTATYELIEKTLMPKNVYHNIYYFTQQAKNFFTALPNNEQKEIFNSILDLSEYKDYYNTTKETIIQKDLELTACDTAVKTTQETLQSLEEMYNERVVSVSNQREELKNKIISLEYEIRQMLSNKKDLQQELLNFENVDDEYNNLKVKYEKLKIEYEHKINNLNLDIERKNNDFENVTIVALKEKFIKLKDDSVKEIDANIKDLDFEIKQLESRMEAYKKEIEYSKNNAIVNIKNKYESSINSLNDQKNELEKKMANSKNKCLEELSKLKDDVQNSINLIKEKLSKCTSDKYIEENRNSSAKKELEKIEFDIEKYKAKLNEPDAVCEMCGQKLVNKDHITKHIHTMEQSISTIMTNIVIIENNISKYSDNIKKYEDEILEKKNYFEEHKRIFSEDYEKQKEQYNKDILKIENELRSINENIQNEIDIFVKEIITKFNNDSKDIDDKILKFNNDIEEYDKKKNAIIVDLRNQYKESYEKVQMELKNELDSINLKIENEKNNFSKLQSLLLQDLNEKLKDVTTKQNLIKDINNINNNLELNEKIIVSYNDELSKDTMDDKSIQEIVHKIKQYKDILKENTNTLNNVQKCKNMLDFWKQAFSDSGIKSMLIDSAIPHMNECVANELDRVAPGVFTVSFDTLSETKSGKVKDKFSINIINNAKGSTGHKKLSGGEKRIIDLCCMSALRSLAEKLYNKRFCHIFYDEILDSLDDEFKQMFCANIKLQSQTGCNVTLVTHDLPEDVDPDRVFPF